MLARKDLLDGIEEKYHEMLKQVNIADFTKCIAQFAGQHITFISDDVIKDYLHQWAYNKYRFFEKLNKKLYVDFPIEYISMDKDKVAAFEEMERQYPPYAPWLDGFKYVNKNKIDSYSDCGHDIREWIYKIFPDNRNLLIGSTITHFFKNSLKAPDELITAIGRVFENDTVKATYTISIDPVDMMLASENPYKWVSCYRLATDNDASHADGCLAAILDTSSLITYVWNNEGKFSLYGEYELKNVRYKRMREWISVSPDEDAIHFNDIYPGKDYPQDFEKLLREHCENWINKDVVWVKNEGYCSGPWCEREYYYGYGEYSSSKIYKIKHEKEDGYCHQSWNVFDTVIYCPCGCGQTLPGSDDGDEYNTYNGEGFVAENFYERHYCELADEYCDSEDCANCPIWNRDNAVCELDESKYCESYYEAEDEGTFDPYSNNVVGCGLHCEGCPLYKYHHPEEEEAEMEDTTPEEPQVEEPQSKVSAVKAITYFDTIEEAQHFVQTPEFNEMCIEPTTVTQGYVPYPIEQYYVEYTKRAN